jgi:hypothetical protein
LSNTQHIVKLQAENIKRLSAVTITPNGNTIVIGGPNGAGKSSVLDSIEYALAGKKSLPKVPLHTGTDKGYVIVETEQYVVKRTFTEKDSYIEVKTKEGYIIGTPQALLDKLVGDLSFDPLEFTRMEPKKQVEVFMRLLGLDFADVDAEYARIEAERRDIGRDGKAVKAQLDAMPADPDAPAVEVVVSDLVKCLEDAREKNASNNRTREALVGVQRELVQHKDMIATLEATLRDAKNALPKFESDVANAKLRADACVDTDTEPITKQIADAESINRRVRNATTRKRLAGEYAEKVRAYESGTTGLREIEAFKEEQIASTQFPVAGVTFGPDGILVNGIPFDQASSAEQLQIAVAMGLSANPELRIILIRDGSLLDETSMAAMAAMAEKYDAQVFLERVGEGKEVSVVIEDGMVKEDRTVKGSSE